MNTRHASHQPTVRAVGVTLDEVALELPRLGHSMEIDPQRRSPRSVLRIARRRSFIPVCGLPVVALCG